MSGDVFDYYNWGKYYWHLVSRVKYPGKHTVHKTASHNKELSGPKFQLYQG